MARCSWIRVYRAGLNKQMRYEMERDIYEKRRKLRHPEVSSRRSSSALRGNESQMRYLISEYRSLRDVPIERLREFGYAKEGNGGQIRIVSIEKQNERIIKEAQKIAERKQKELAETDLEHRDPDDAHMEERGPPKIKDYDWDLASYFSACRFYGRR